MKLQILISLSNDIDSKYQKIEELENLPTYDPTTPSNRMIRLKNNKSYINAKMNNFSYLKKVNINC